jgi:hypothetical protein
MGAEVLDFRFWETGPGRFGCVVTLLAWDVISTEDYRKALSEVAPLDHVTVEVRPRPAPQAFDARGVPCRTG